jgi:hypothetical protein
MPNTLTEAEQIEVINHYLDDIADVRAVNAIYLVEIRHAPPDSDFLDETVYRDRAAAIEHARSFTGHYPARVWMETEENGRLVRWLLNLANEPA